MIDTEFFFGPLVGAALVLISSVLLYWYSIRNFDYWEKLNVPYAKPYPFVGCVLEAMRKLTILEVKNKLARDEYRNCSSSRKSRGLFRPMGIDQQTQVKKPRVK
ncbi:hypothetical protein TNCV_4322671 [Trichonephila clavipes]|nr:hypothetical protein TNCV_4322671 [Trichonephila clavipes]